MNIITVIGTRPQYIKVKPLYDYCKSNNINNVIVDTLQHYSSNMSSSFIDEFNLNIDYSLNICNETEKDFISDGIKKLYECFLRSNPDIVIVLGDTNTTLCSSLVASKLRIPVAHIESGIRCGSRNRPEEINRIIVDDLADIHFTSRKKDNANVRNPVYVGDIEYILLNQLDGGGYIKDVVYDDFLLMTLHRQENMNKKRLVNIFKFCKKTKDFIIFPIHHRARKIIEKNNIKVPKNISIQEPKSYRDIINLLSSCSGVISDSGGVIKTVPFFGKKCIIPFCGTEWDDVVEEGYASLDLDYNFLLNKCMPIRKDFYLNKDCCSVIIDTLKYFCEHK
jgi:UDP-N-acetylglucosamine 2-epimerase